MRQPWLYSPGVDGALLIAPAFAVTALVLLFPRWFAAAGDLPPWGWLVLVVGIDVAHVWSTLFRTYLDKAAMARYRTPLIGVPLVCWLGGVILYGFDGLLFWRVLAYLAAFHFVRQQYGFFRLYARHERHSPASRGIDNAAIYLATCYPLLYWHTHPRAFDWFLPGDFLRIPWVWLEPPVRWVYLAVLAAYVGKESVARRWNLPKNLILAGTALSWYTGIVWANGDIAFTVTNVVAHGVPYLGLIWFYQRRNGENAAWFRWRNAPVYAGAVFALAYVEEGFWDSLVWRDHEAFFPWLPLPQVEDPALLSLIVPLLAVPQASHYLLDAILWRIRPDAPG